MVVNYIKRIVTFLLLIFKRNQAKIKPGRILVIKGINFILCNGLDL